MSHDKLSVLMAAHQLMQLGCYFDGVDTLPSGDSYLWSSKIPDTSWNFAVCQRVSAEVIDWVRASARSHDRQPAIFWPQAGLTEILKDHGVGVTETPERWMVANLGLLSEPVLPSAVSRYEIVTSASPGLDFETVFGQLFAQESINTHFRNVYVPALRSARASSGTQYFHLIGYQGDQPFVCASAYRRHHITGLYNVGTVYHSQRKGVGKWASQRILQEARQAGANEAFLQCEVGTHVERLYASMGFSVLATPVIGVFGNV